ncbi:cation diffusion facilitator family transporter, partial [uncultured Veillonella sp.]|uniref:cation diffusion facilitator family transporter n=1 Tax=uncultured Veillonella sp. TaxID=159268 RepID=UPI00262929F8
MSEGIGMQDLLIRMYVPNRECIKAPTVRTKYGDLASVVGIIVNLIICIGEVAVGILIGSLAMISDGIHNVTDAGGSLISLISFRLGAKKADEVHPFGFGRMEYLLSIGFSLLLFVLAIQILIEAVHRIITPEVVPFSLTSVVVMLCAMGLKFWLYTFLKYVGNLVDSPILRANSLETLSDIWGIAGVTIGLVIGGLFALPVDGYLSFLVALLIGRAGYHVLSDAITRILGQEPSPELVKSIVDLVKSYKGVEGVHDLVVHDYGPGNVFASIHVEVDAKVDVIKSHALVDRIERDVANNLYVNLTIHMDPRIINDEMIKLYN